ncbi:MAG: sodium:calcium antiporter [Gammaproteobacteria bacterium]|nr:sodium:calcium antiporter [Gammaproteobacteria bacterium]
MIWLFLLASLVAILLAAEIFTNALEHLGQRLKISEGVTGSLFAAVGTAMPETMVPVLAIVAGTGDMAVNHAIGVGAIVGAPLMLGTLAFFLMGAAAFGVRGFRGGVVPEPTGMKRDLDFFLVAFLLAGLGLLPPAEWAYSGLVRGGLAITLVLLYLYYVVCTLRSSAQLVEEGHGTLADRGMYLCRLGLPDSLPVVIGQILFGFGLLVGGAKAFIHAIEQLSVLLTISALILSLLIIPVATELPEKVNSILWIRRRKDTLAVGNLTGAMVFQGTLLPALGLLATPWQPAVPVVLALGLTMVAALWLRWHLTHGGLQVRHLSVNGLCYLLYLLAMLWIIRTGVA